MIYDGVNPIVFNNIPRSTKRILDIGCGSAALGRAIKNVMDCKVMGITYSEAEAAIVRDHINKVIIADLNNIDFHL